MQNDEVNQSIEEVEEKNEEDLDTSQKDEFNQTPESTPNENNSTLNNEEKSSKNENILQEFNEIETQDNHQENKNKEKVGSERKNQPTEGNNEKIEIQSGLLNVGVLENTTLNAECIEVENGYIIRLSFSGYSLLNLGLLSNAYTIFHLPSAIANVIEPENLTATYDVPRISLLGIVLRNQGTFDTDDIIIDGNQVYMETGSLLSLNLLSSKDYNYTLEIELDELPPSNNGEYVFYSQKTKELANISLLEGENVARDTLPAPQIPEAPIIDEPVYTTDTKITGFGEPNAEIILTINEEEYRRPIDSEGYFSVDIPAQEAGTEMQAIVMSEEGYSSEATFITVTEPPDTTPPEPPILDQVYSDDTIVSGNGESESRLVLTIGEIEYTEYVDSEGQFNVNIPAQEPGTKITAVLVDEAGNISPETEMIVKPPPILTFEVPEILLFEPISIVSHPVIATRQDSDWSIEVIDTRETESSWKVTAEAEQPLTSYPDGQHTLPNALIYVDEQNEKHYLENGPVEVFSGEKGGDAITSVEWEEDQGPLLEVNPADAYTQEYRAVITWTLTDAP